MPNKTGIILGIGFGMWSSTWLSIVSPLVPFCISYGFMFYGLFLTSNAHHESRRNKK